MLLTSCYIEWKGETGKEHFLRKEPYNVEGIPSLGRWDTVNQKMLSGMLGESDCQQIELVNSFVEKLSSS